jgi:hypothetical protein
LKSGRLTGQASGAEHSTVNYAVTADAVVPNYR